MLNKTLSIIFIAAAVMAEECAEGQIDKTWNETFSPALLQDVKTCSNHPIWKATTKELCDIESCKNMFKALPQLLDALPKCTVNGVDVKTKSKQGVDPMVKIWDETCSAASSHFVASWTIVLLALCTLLIEL